MKTSAGLRAQLRTGSAALWTAVTATLLWQGVDMPSELLVAWGGVYFAAFGIGEAVYDARAGR